MLSLHANCRAKGGTLIFKLRVSLSGIRAVGQQTCMLESAEDVASAQFTVQNNVVATGGLPAGPVPTLLVCAGFCDLVPNGLPASWIFRIFEVVIF